MKPQRTKRVLLFTFLVFAALCVVVIMARAIQAMPWYLHIDGMLVPDPALANLRQPRTDAWYVEIPIPWNAVDMLRERTRGVQGSLDVELLLVSTPTTVFRGKLPIEQIATAKRDVADSCRARVRIHPVNGDISARATIPTELLLPGTEVHTKLHCSSSP